MGGTDHHDDCGLAQFEGSDPVEHDGLLQTANRDAAVLLNRDPKLESPRGLAVRTLLRMFNRRAALETLAAG